MSRRIRLTVVMTHPIQYYSPWFRFIAHEADELQLTVLYVTEPSGDQQGVGFDESFAWDVPLTDGYESVVYRPSRESDRFASDRFFGLDAPGIGRAIEKLKPDSVLLSGWHSLGLVRAIFACRRRGIPLLYRGDTNLQGRERNILWRFRSRRLLGLFDRFLCVGTRVQEYLESLGIASRHIFPSPHAVDNEFFSIQVEPLLEAEARVEARRGWGIGPDDFVVLFVGKLDRNKRPGDVLRALGSMNGNARALIAGSGPLREECTELVSRLRVAAEFRGFLNQTELPVAYAVADCLALPSQSETWGLVVNEAMACGVPCVVSEGVGCAPDLVEPGETGEIFPLGDIDALSNRLTLISEEIEAGRTRARQCREKVRPYSFEAATSGLLSACRTVMR